MQLINSQLVNYGILLKYYIMKDNTSGHPIITTGHGQKDSEIRIRCVRDADPVTKSYDSSYGSGGTGFGL